MVNTRLVTAPAPFGGEFDDGGPLRKQRFVPRGIAGAHVSTSIQQKYCAGRGRRHYFGADIIRGLSVVGPDCLTRPVSQSKTKKVVTCQETDTLEELMAMMTALRFRHLPVLVTWQKCRWRPQRCASKLRTAKPAGWLPVRLAERRAQSLQACRPCTAITTVTAHGVETSRNAALRCRLLACRPKPQHCGEG